MPSPEMKRKAWAAGLLVLPIVLVKVTSNVMQPAPAAAALTPTEALDQAAEVIEIAKPSSAQLEAARYIAALRAQPFGRSPLLVNAAPAADPARQEVAPTPVPGQPEFTLQAIMSSANGAKAVIDGRPYAVGELVGGTQWRLVEANGDTRAATLLESESGRTIELSVELERRSDS